MPGDMQWATYEGALHADDDDGDDDDDERANSQLPTSGQSATIWLCMLLTS